jgi:hypothetical protein
VIPCTESTSSELVKDATDNTKLQKRYTIVVQGKNAVDEKVERILKEKSEVEEKVERILKEKDEVE